MHAVFVCLPKMLAILLLTMVFDLLLVPEPGKEEL
jgi:hypothetical protein